MNDELQDGDTLGDFRIVRRLGAGAMGVVYEAVEVSLQRTVALKVLPLEVSANPSRRARFLREARAAAAVTHPAVVAIFQIGASDGRDFIAMELVRGRNLRQVLADGPLSIARAVRLAQAIASGLGRAHEAGVVHRDVKPDNVMVTPDDGVKVLDFGIARIDPAGVQPSDKRPGESDKNPPPVTALTGEGHLIGTPGYMAPEQSRGATIDARADVFALGAMMYEMLSGLRPFSGDTPLAVIISSARDDVPPLLGVRGDVPPALAAVVDRCLAKDPNDRFPNGRAVADALADVALPKRGDDAVALMLDTIDAPPPTGAPRSPIASTPPKVPSATGAPAPPAPRRSRVLPIAIGLTLIAGATIAVLAATRGADTTPTASASPTPSASASTAPAVAPATSPSAPDALASGADASPGAPTVTADGPLVRADDAAVIPCVIFETRGTDGPGGWLGAAAADSACMRLTLYLGLDFERTRSPAELLHLPSSPSDDFPFDPFSAPDARDKTLSAARAMGPVWMDGNVEVRPTDFAVVIRLGGDDHRAARGEGRSVQLAVAHALDALVRSGAVAPATTLGPEASWFGADDVAGVLAISDAHDAIENNLEVDAAFAALDASAAHIRSDTLLGLTLGRDMVRGRAIDPQLPVPPLDDATPQALLQSIILQSYFANVERRPLIDRMAAVRAKVTDPIGVSMLACEEAALRLKDGDTEGALPLLLRAMERSPRLVDWAAVRWAVYGSSLESAVLRASLAWSPADGAPFLSLTSIKPGATPAELVPYAGRGALLQPGVHSQSVMAVRTLLLAGKPMAARSIGARLADQPTFGVVTDDIELKVAASEGAFGRALDRAEKTLASMDVFGDTVGADTDILSWALQLAAMLGRSSELGDMFAKRFVLVDPPRLTPNLVAAYYASAGCAEASPDVTRRCVARIRALVDAGFFTNGRYATYETLLEVVQHFAQGEMKAAAEAYRPAIASGGNSGFGARAFDAIGEPDTASIIDQRMFTNAPFYHGATLAHVREARRALGRKDFAAARKLAQTVIDAWSVADVVVPAVAEMKALLAKLPPAAAPH